MVAAADSKQAAPVAIPLICHPVVTVDTTPAHALKYKMLLIFESAAFPALRALFFFSSIASPPFLLDHINRTGLSSKLNTLRRVSHVYVYNVPRHPARIFYDSFAYSLDI